VTPDVNVLVAASRSDHPHHKDAIVWLKRAIAACRGGASVEILPMIASGFLRLVTHPKVFAHPTPTDDALAFLDALLATPGVEMPGLGGEWTTLRQMCGEAKLTGNDIPDAWIAAAVRTLGSHLVTFDRGFSKRLGKRELTILPDG
jgi:uncharacterized protein